jgi:N-acetylglucosaminyldiphosphoundecaprenol N-acetyl-beta-D-mannosaminyltransferase
VRWALNFFHKANLQDRVYGPEVMRLICQRCAELGLSIFLCGSTPVVLQIAGVASPPFRPMTEEENDELCRKINRSGAAVAFIGLGVPRQEIFADKNRHKINAVQLCVGAAFDFHAGNKRTAPAFMQRMGLEWLFRLSQEPSRLWKRYLVTNSIFIGLVFATTMKRLHRRYFPVRGLST